VAGTAGTECQTWTERSTFQPFHHPNEQKGFVGDPEPGGRRYSGIAGDSGMDLRWQRKNIRRLGVFT
jgi:hypothetical protein